MLPCHRVTGVLSASLLFVLLLQPRTAISRSRRASGSQQRKYSQADENSENSIDHRYFLQEIFTKYGTGGVLTFEGFEHLLASLGLGQLKFDFGHPLSAHVKNGSFTENHDEIQMDSHKHAHDDDSSDVKWKKQPPSQDDVNEKTHADDDDFSRRKRNLKESDDEDLNALETLLENHSEDNSAIGTTKHAEKTGNRKQIGCLTPAQLLSAFGLKPYHSHLTPLHFLHICPAIIYDLDRQSCRSISYGAGHEAEAESLIHSFQVWAYAIGTIVALSLIGLLMIALVPARQGLLQFLVAVAIGTLSGDALIHLLPNALGIAHGGHAEDESINSNPASNKSVNARYIPMQLMSMEEEDGSEVVIWKAYAAFISIVVFWAIETGLRLFSQRKVNKVEPKKTVVDKGDPLEMDSLSMNNDKQTELDNKSRSRKMHSHSHGNGTSASNGTSAAAWMIVVGDTLHNFSDGLAVGASFAAGIPSGVATAVAVFCHELPHELGDFAALIGSGLSRKHAIILQLPGCILAVIGVIAGVFLGTLPSAGSWIAAITAGGFIYIAFVVLAPSLNATCNSMQAMLKQILGVTVGGILMLSVAIIEPYLKSVSS